MKIPQDSLRSITFAAFVMAAIDGFMDDSEVETISRFVQEEWSFDYGSIDPFMREIDEQIVEFF